MLAAWGANRAQSNLHQCYCNTIECVPLQEDNEPICIDSDEGDHAAGSVPARDSDQNGAAPALRRSERSNITKSTIQIFKVMQRLARCYCEYVGKASITRWSLQALVHVVLTAGNVAYCAHLL